MAGHKSCKAPISMLSWVYAFKLHIPKPTRSVPLALCRMTFQTEFVPIAPALCCKACLSERVHPVNSCADRAMCSGHGVCILGQCERTGGFRGGDCSVRAPRSLRERQQRQPIWPAVLGRLWRPAPRAGFHTSSVPSKLQHALSSGGADSAYCCGACLHVNCRELLILAKYRAHIRWRPPILPHAAQIGPFSDSDSLPQWAIALIVMGSCITLAIVMVLIAKAMHYYNLIMSPGALTLYLYLPCTFCTRRWRKPWVRTMFCCSGRHASSRALRGKWALTWPMTCVHCASGRNCS